MARVDPIYIDFTDESKELIRDFNKTVSCLDKIVLINGKTMKETLKSALIRYGVRKINASGLEAELWELLKDKPQ